MENVAAINFGQAMMLRPLISDLKVHLIINKSSIPFITYDNPTFYATNI
jgi:hypothetical protein